MTYESVPNRSEIAIACDLTHDLGYSQSQSMSSDRSPPLSGKSYSEDTFDESGKSAKVEPSGDFAPGGAGGGRE